MVDGPGQPAAARARDAVDAGAKETVSSAEPASAAATATLEAEIRALIAR
jgi:hypothetical protein